MVRGGLRLDDDSIARLVDAQSYRNRWSRRALWISALALLAIALWTLAMLGWPPAH